MNAIAIPAEVRQLLDRFEKQSLKLGSIELFAEAIDILIDDFPPDSGRWMRPDFEPILAAYARSLLSKVIGMDRSDEALVLAVARLVHRKCFPSVVAAAKCNVALAEAYESMLFAWQDLASVALPIR